MRSLVRMCTRMLMWAFKAKLYTGTLLLLTVVLMCILLPIPARLLSLRGPLP